ncbi:MAG TPA: helix-turn-helix domain-containing protein [Chloroflexota bacterium]|jgi:hypothetical protein|nr:helix-turn-helix domain-containing protein [Chloroflexota bacterium]
MSKAVLDRAAIEQSLALLETAAVTDANVKAAADTLKRALREADARTLLTTAEAASALGIRSINTIKRWVKTGYIHGVQRNGRTLIPGSEIERIQNDDRVRDQRTLSNMHEEIADFGRELTDAEMQALKATRPGRPPWERQG